MSYKVIGVDPGLINTGYGVILSEGAHRLKMLEAGVIRTSTGDDISKRIGIIYNNLNEIIKEHKPEVLVLEKIYAHYKHPATAILMGHARGVVCLASGENGLKLVNYGATRIKKALTGNGRATKIQVQSTVRNILGLKSAPKPLDVSDALATAITYVYIEDRG